MRRGFTLLELMLVLVVLVVAAALVWPLADRAFATQTLRSSADVVRAAWVDARVKAITTGQPHVFFFQPGTDAFHVEPFRGTSPEAELLSQDELMNVQQEFAMIGHVKKTLPDGITFEIGGLEFDTRGAALEELSTRGQGFQARSQAPRPLGAEDPDAMWAPPLYFYPDGTTSTAKVGITNEHGLIIVISLRGLTGTVSVSPPVTFDELPEVLAQ